MRKIVQMFRSRNHTVVYMVVRDSRTNTIEVWKCSPDTTEMEHCRTFEFTLAEAGWAIRSTSETAATRRATNLANALSRMAPSEVIKQADNIRQFGEVR